MVAFLHEPDEVAHDIRALGMRHIKYAIPADYFPLFGESLVIVLPGVLEGYWDDSVRGAWEGVFEFVKNCMTRAVLSGTNLVTKALVKNSPEDCADAIDQAPRCERNLWMLEVDVSNIKVSPFFWGIQDSKLDVSKFMLEDILCIRADREAYYYGKDELFRVHPDLIEFMCKLAPQLLVVVFDGLMWHSRNIEDGKRRVNYYMRDIYGDPNMERFADPYKTPLAELTRLHNSAVFVHPFVLFVLDLKWSQFSRDMYMKSQFIYTLQLVFFMVGWVMLDQKDDIAFGFRIAAMSIASYVLLVTQVPRILREIYQKQVVNIGCGIRIPVFLTKLTNAGRLLVSISLVCSFALDEHFDEALGIENRAEAVALFEGLASCVMWALLLDLSQLSLVLLKFQHKLGAVIVQFFIFYACLLVCLMGFATGMYLADHPVITHFDNVWHSILYLYATFLGIYSFYLYEFSAQMLLLFFLFSVGAVLMLGRLILAIMTSVTVNQDSQVEGYAFLERAQLSVELESMCSLGFRQRVWAKMGCESSVEFDAGDMGPGGGLQVREVVGRQMSQRAADDRIMRFPGECDKNKPWPKVDTSNDKNIGDRLDKLESLGDRIRKTLNDLQKRGTMKGGGLLPTLSEGESGEGGEKGALGNDKSGSGNDDDDIDMDEE